MTLRFNKMLCKLLAAAALLKMALADVMDREVYDDTPGDMELMYPEPNYVDMDMLAETAAPRTKPRPTAPPRKLSEHARKMLSYKMLNTLRNEDASPNFLSVPKWISTGTVLVPPDTFNYSPLKGPLGNMFKRSEHVGALKPKLKWKAKKVKAGSRICYFKLCAFYPPN